MTTIQKLTLADNKLQWFIQNKSTASYALTELAEVRKLLSEVKEKIQDALPQVVDVLDGKANITYPK